MNLCKYLILKEDMCKTTVELHSKMPVFVEILRSEGLKKLGPSSPRVQFKKSNSYCKLLIFKFEFDLVDAQKGSRIHSDQKRPHKLR